MNDRSELRRITRRVQLRRAAQERRLRESQPESQTTDDAGQLDDLLARSIAHRAILEILVGLALPLDEQRALARESACRELEALSSLPISSRAHEAVERGLAEIDEVLGLEEEAQPSFAKGAG